MDRMKFESPFAAALNLMLESEPWARERLAPFAGEVLELRAPPLPALRFSVVAIATRMASRPTSGGMRWQTRWHWHSVVPSRRR